MVKRAPPDLLTVTQAAALLQTTRQAIYNAVKRERITAEERYGLTLISRAALLAYKKKRHAGGRPPKRPRSTQ